MRRNDVEGLIERLRNDVVGLHNEHPAVETMVEAAEALSRHMAAGEVMKEIAERLIDQRDEPWPGGTETDRLHYWRDKAISASRDIRATLNSIGADREG